MKVKKEQSKPLPQMGPTRHIPLAAIRRMVELTQNGGRCTQDAQAIVLATPPLDALVAAMPDLARVVIEEHEWRFRALVNEGFAHAATLEREIADMIRGMLGRAVGMATLANILAELDNK